MTDIHQPWRDWTGTALVVGCGSIGQALLGELARCAPGLRIHGASRRPGRWSSPDGISIPFQFVDLNEPSTLLQLREALTEQPPLRVVFNTVGVLQNETFQPEKRLSQVTQANLAASFSVNAFGAILLAQALEPLWPRDEPFHFASLSARVGSIGDNQLGGWYSYRAAKAAQNQLLHTLAIEWKRRFPLSCVSLFHPGTTDSALSKPFQANVSPDKLFSPERAARQLLAVLDALRPEHSGQFWAWDGQAIPW